MNFELQPQLSDDVIKLRPLRRDDLDELYRAASDPLIWEQHPNPNRYQRKDFDVYFQGAMESGGALLAMDGRTGEVIGCSRFYELDQAERSIAIGYTFLIRRCWGGGCNRAMKILMLDHAFKYVDIVIFHVGVNNIRSQKAMERLGAAQIGRMDKQYFGEQVNANFIYRIKIQDWPKLRSK